MKNGLTNISVVKQLGEVMFRAYDVVLAANVFCVLPIGLCGCVNLCCNGFMDINSDF